MPSSVRTFRTLKYQRVSSTNWSRFMCNQHCTRDSELHCCQWCVIVQKAHRALTDFRKYSGSSLEVYPSVYDMVNATLCPKDPQTCWHKQACLNLSCNKCDNLEFSEEETSSSGVLTWQTLHYVDIKTANRTIRKLKLVTHHTAPSTLVEHNKKHMFAKKNCITSLHKQAVA